VLAVVISSCNWFSNYPTSVRSALDLAGENRGELLEVIHHYSENPGDSLKLEAAYFLIGNMPGHEFQVESDIFEPALDSAAKYSEIFDGMEYFRDEVHSIRREHPREFDNDSAVVDLEHVTADFLIENINLAFEAYRRIPQEHRSSYDLFLKYVLPYRVSDEPLEFDNRKRQYQNYQWVYDEFEAGRPTHEVIQAVLDSVELGLMFLETGYPGRFTARQVETTRFGICADLVNYTANLFRAIGIPTSNDLTPHWGNRHTLGHNWLAFPSEDSMLAMGMPDENRLDRLYKYESMPKAYRHTYADHDEVYPFVADVTEQYKESNRIRIVNRWNKDPAGQPVYLAVIDRRRGWLPLDKAEESAGDRFTFEDIAPHVVFLAGFYDETNTLQPLNYPFTVDDDNTVNYFDLGSEATIDSAILKRKYPPYFVSWWEAKLLSIEAVNGLKIQASNNESFQPHRDLLTISDFNTTQIKNIPLAYEGEYRYYRIIRPDTTTWVWLAKLRFNADQPYRQVQARNLEGSFEMAKLQDEDPLSYNGGRGVEVRYSFPEPVKVNSIDIQPRNDDNHIRIGDIYELMYWDKEWRSLGQKVADDTTLVYRNVPANALFWLRNHTRGKEEHVFTITAEGKQWWPGISNISMPLPWMEPTTEF
jgi:hypothetical protein